MEWLTEAGPAAMATLLSIEVLFLLTKLIGSKQVSQMTMFDYIVGITIGSVAAVLEHDGVVSFLQKEAARRTTLFIMDSMLLTENIRKVKKKESWVRRALLCQGYKSEKDVLLTLWDGVKI